MLRNNVDKSKLKAYLKRIQPTPSAATFRQMRLLVGEYVTAFDGKPLGNLGFLANMVNLVEHCYAATFPIDIANYKTPNGDQIRSQETQPKRVLKQIDCSFGFGSMAGRTNKTNLMYATSFIDKLNDFHVKNGFKPRFDYLFIIWLIYVIRFHAKTPLDLTFDTKLTLREFIRGLLEALRKRDKDLGSGKKLAGLVLQHLVGAKLEIMCEGSHTKIDHHPAFQSDLLYGRKGDFEIGDFVVHVTTSPSAVLIEKCLYNINEGLRPIIITPHRQAAVASALAEGADAERRIEVFDVEGFFSTNLFEWVVRGAGSRKATIERLIDRYNMLVDAHDKTTGIHITIK